MKWVRVRYRPHLSLCFAKLFPKGKIKKPGHIRDRAFHLLLMDNLLLPKFFYKIPPGGEHQVL